MVPLFSRYHQASAPSALGCERDRGRPAKDAFQIYLKHCMFTFVSSAIRSYGSSLTSYCIAEWVGAPSLESHQL